MEILDPGHIYKLINPVSGEEEITTFVKRSGGRIHYAKEWPGVQTQAVMRALIYHLQYLKTNGNITKTYPLWQLGLKVSQDLRIRNTIHVCQLLSVLIDRSQYLDAILECVETKDAIGWMNLARMALLDGSLEYIEKCEEAVGYIRLALWCYEARAYRRKQEEVNREEPAHDDTARPRPWRWFPCDDVPFNEIDIERRPIGADGHIVLDQKEMVFT